MKNQLRLFVSFFLVIFFYFPVFSQLNVTIDPPGSGAADYTFDLPQLKTKTKYVTEPAFYKQVLIFGDGSFSVDSTSQKGSIQHTFGVPVWSTITGYNSRLYSTGVYGGGEDEPPLNRVGPIAPPAAGVGTTKAMVDSNRYLRIFRNVEVKPGDPFIIVVSVKNPTQLDMSGTLTFMYNGKLRTITNTLMNSLQEYSTFKLRENLFYRPDVANSPTYYYSKLDPVLGSFYGDLWSTKISNLSPGDEVHYFIDIVGAEKMMELFAGTSKAEMDFAAAFSVNFDNNGFPNLIPDTLRAEVEDLGLSNFLNSLGNMTPDSSSFYNVSSDTTIRQTGDLSAVNFNDALIVDYYKSTAQLKKSHDPNFMLVEACVCPEESDRYQLFTTVQCENSGYEETDHIFIDIKLPPGIDSSDVSAIPIKYHPYGNSGDQIRMIKLTEDSIRWELLNFGLDGTPIYGVGHPRTFANVQFNMYSSVLPADLDSIYACIRFDKLTNDPVCTVPVAVNLLDVATAKEGQVLTCTPGSCDDDTGSTTGCEDCCCWCWWLFIGLVVTLLILLIVWLRRRSAS